MDIKKKFVLEFDEPPAFIFVSKDGVREEAVYQNGKKVKFWTGLDLHSEYGEPTTYEIEYITVKDKDVVCK